MPKNLIIALALSVTVSTIAHSTTLNGPNGEECISYLTDIRNYTAPSMAIREKSYELKLESKAASYSLMVNSGANRAHGKLLVQIVRHRYYDPTIEKILSELTQQVFNIPPEQMGQQNHFLVEKMDRTELDRKMKSFNKSLQKAFVQSEQIPHYIPRKTRSTRVEGIRNLLTDYLELNGFDTADKVFEISLSRIHMNFISSLSIIEASFFHYSIFDRQMTMKGEEIQESAIKAWKELLGDKSPTSDELTESIRSKLLSTASKEMQKYQNAKKTVNLALEDLSEFLKSSLKNIETTTYFKKLPKEYKALFNRPLQVEDRALIQEFRQHTNNFRSNFWYLNREPGFTRFDSNLVWVIENVERRFAALERFSNANPFDAEVDHARNVLMPNVRLTVLNSDSNVKGARYVAPDALSQAGAHSVMAGVSRSLSRAELSEESADDSVAPIEDEMKNTEVIQLLHSVGIRNVAEITKYSAQDFVEKFQFNKDQLLSLLDELNAMGIHLYFDGKWDADHLQIRKDRPEYYEYRHVPGGNVKWQYGRSTSDEVGDWD